MTSQSKDGSDENKKSSGKPEGSVGIVARATEDAAERANDRVRKTRARFDEQISKQREQLTGKVRTLGRALRGAGEMLEEDNVIAHGLHYTSDKVTHVADYIDELNPTVVVEDLRDIARRKPLWFFGGAFSLGLLLARFARSTATAGETSGDRSAASGRRSLGPSAEASTKTGASAPDNAKEQTKRKSGPDAASARAGTSTTRSSGSPT
ncbi:MAG TPA: hypothetical protein VFZ61_10110 [Polyangiales bacterium]